MAYQLTSHIRNIRGVTPSERNVLYELSAYDQGNGAWPSIKTLAENLDISVRGIRQILQHLETKEIIKRERRQNDAGASIPTVYLIIGFNYDTISPKKPVSAAVAEEAAQPCTPTPPPCTAMPDLCTAVPTSLHSHADPPAPPCMPNKEGKVIGKVIRTVRENGASLSLQKTEPTSTPQTTNIFTWLRYARGRDRQNQPRMTPAVERIFNSVSSYARVYGPEAGARFAREEFESLPAIWQDYLASIQEGIGA